MSSKGYKQKPEHIAKRIAIVTPKLIGRKLSDEHKKKIGKAGLGNTHGFKKGQSAWNKDKKGIYKLGTPSDEHKIKLAVSKMGSKNPSWNNGSSLLPYTVDWTKTLRQSIRERDFYTCQLCKEPQGDETLAVHHIDYEKKNCDPKNLITLCNSCHMKTNHNRSHWLALFTQSTVA